MPEEFDIVVVGAGPGGHAAAVRAAQRGARTAIVEQQGWGGTCTHRGCIPTKALLSCSKRYAELKKLGRMGVRVADPSFDYAAMKRHQEQIVKISAMGVRKSLTDSGCVMKDGAGRILSPGEVEWTAPDGASSILSARDLIVAWGSEPALPPGVNGTISRMGRAGHASAANAAVPMSAVHATPASNACFTTLLFMSEPPYGCLILPSIVAPLVTMRAIAASS